MVNLQKTKWQQIKFHHIPIEVHLNTFDRLIVYNSPVQNNFLEIRDLFV